jgi:putative nucleotidyltransferase with HDIG domain
MPLLGGFGMRSDTVMPQETLQPSLSDRPEPFVKALHMLIEHDPCTFRHCYRVEKLAVKLAAKFLLPPHTIDILSEAALLHDIGKLRIPKKLLQKSTRLTATEAELLKQHADYGFLIAGVITRQDEIATAVLHHHERFDGNGYPYGNAGEDIPLLSRIIRIADTYEALTSERPYRKAMTPAEALQVIRTGRNSHFDPTLADVFIRLIRDYQNPAVYDDLEALIITLKDQPEAIAERHFHNRLKGLLTDYTVQANPQH